MKSASLDSDNRVIEQAPVQERNHVNREREIAGVFLAGARWGLHRDDVVILHGLVPFLEARRAAIAAGNREFSQFSAPFEIVRDIFGRRILCVDEQCYSGPRCHG